MSCLYSPGCWFSMKVILFAFSILAVTTAVPFGYQKEHRYTHDYETEVTHAIPGGSDETLGLRIKCAAHLDVLMKDTYQLKLENVQVKQVIGNLKDPSQDKEQQVDQDIVQATEQKLKLPVNVVLKTEDGSIKEIYAHGQDEEWSQNVKRGLANLLQLTVDAQDLAKSEKQFVTKLEETAVGKCTVAYHISPEEPASSGQSNCVTKVTKVMNYEDCKTRPEFKQSIYYGQQCRKCERSIGHAPYYRSFGQIEHVLSGSAKAGYTIKRTEAREQHVITPYSEMGGQVVVSTRQTLVYKDSSVIQAVSEPLPKKIGIQFVAENPDILWKGNAQYQSQLKTEVLSMVDQISKMMEKSQTQQMAEKMAQMVQAMQKCNRKTMDELADNMLKRQDQSLRKACLDALSQVGTTESFQTLQQKIEKSQLNKDELSRVFLGWPFSPQPCAKQIEITWDLCQHANVKSQPSARRQCMLAFGALAKKASELPSSQQDTRLITTLEDYTQKLIDQLNSEQTTPDEKLMCVKTLGNAGSIKARQSLQNLVKDQQQPLDLRVECVWALRHIVKQTKDYTDLIAAFCDAQQHPELRMAIFALLLNCEPHFFVLQALTNCAARETSSQGPGPRSNQVASFVISHLSALAFHNNVLTKTRSMNARLALRLMPKISFDLSYSKGMRLVQFCEKFQTGFELEANVIKVPESMFPRNLNARMQLHTLGQRINGLEFGARIENMDGVVEQIISDIRRRHKRSLWGSLLSFFNDGLPKGTQRPSFQPSSRPTSHPSYQPSSRGQSSQRPTSRPTGSAPTSQAPTKGPQKQESRKLSAYLKLFGDELKFVQVGKADIDKLAQEIGDIVLGTKEKVEYPDIGIVISKQGIDFEQNVEKAMMTAYARQMIPTLCGIPLDMCVQSVGAMKLHLKGDVKTEGSVFNFYKQKKLTASVQFTPSVGMHWQAQVGVHTPFLRLGMRVKASGRTDQEHGASATFQYGKQYQATYNIPQRQRDILKYESDVKGFAITMKPKTYAKQTQEIPVQLYTPHLRQVEKGCAGGNLFGVDFCMEGRVPDFATISFQQIPVFPTVDQTKLCVTMAPTEDRPKSIQFTTQVTSNDDKATHCEGNIDASSGTVKRQIPLKVTYRSASQQQQAELQIDCCKINAPKYQNSFLKISAKPVTLKQWNAQVQFAAQEKAEPQYQVSADGRIQNEGESLRLETSWTKVPEEWKTFFYNWEPQILHLLQQFAWVNRPESRKNAVSFQFQLKSPETADMQLQTPDLLAERTDLSLPVRVERLPTCLADIENYFYAQCQVQSNSIKMFDRLQIQHNIPRGCPYVLARDRRQDKECRIQLSLQIEKDNKQTLIASIKQPVQTEIKIQVHSAGSSISIDGTKQECKEQACEAQQGEATVRSERLQGGKTLVRLSTKAGLYAVVQDQQIEVQASPLLRSRVRGLCGDANGEQWNEFKDPQDNVENSVDKFIQSWQQKQC